MSDRAAATPHGRDDQPTRDRIRGSLDESLLVEAAAGTGKTTELIERLVAVLEQGRAEVEQVVAVTFTRKAAGELKLRLRERLDRAFSDAAPSGRVHLERAIARLEGAQIGTIHSFCAEILRERPVEAGVDPGFVEVADDESPRLFARAFDGWIQQRLETMPVGIRRALSRLALSSGFFDDPPLERLCAAGWQLAEWRDHPAPWRREPFARDDEIDELVERVARLSEWARRCANTYDELRKSLQPVVLLATWIERSEALAPRDFDALEARLLELLKQLRKPWNRRSGRGKFAEALPREQVTAARDGLRAALEGFQERADADLAALLHAELQGAVAAYEDLKRSIGKLDFSDLLIRARDLVRDHPAVRAHLQDRYAYLFVDEFQDTDPLQAEILLLLAADDPKAQDWRRARPRPGKLFLVGDPKQSIYRFRRADLLLYNQVKETLARGGVGVVNLTRSFRSVEPIQRFVNCAFAPEMDGDASRGRPHYIPLAEHRKAREGQPAIVALPVPRPYGERGITGKAIEASLPDAVAAWIHWLLEESKFQVEDPELRQPVAVEPHHICILFRRFVSWGRDVTRDYTTALEARGVAHLLIGARTFHRREEVETLRAALTAVEWPDDDLAVYATLRGSLFALSDEQLMRFAAAAGTLHPFHWRRSSGLGPTGDWEPTAPREPGSAPAAEPEELRAVGEVLDILATLHRRRNQRAIVETVQSLLAVTRAHAGFALRPAGVRALGNVERVCELARGYELAGGRSFRGFVEELANEAEKLSSNQAPMVEEGAEGVRLMTVHNAKGLEFPVVVLADMTCQISRPDPDRTVDPERGLAASRLLGWTPHELLESKEIEAERDRAEGVRIAYVAATRARDLLVVPAVGDRANRGWLEPLNRALYPDTAGWRRADPAPGCPELGASSVLERPPDQQSRIEGSVRPGLHRRDGGENATFDPFDVVWWDPAVLELGVEAGVGLRREEILAPDEGAVVALRNRARYLDWVAEQERIRGDGRRPSFDVTAVTELETDPPDIDVAAVAVEEVARDRGRPAGRRFGELVHNLLRQIAFSANASEVEALARALGRELGAEPAEIEAAKDAVCRALGHPRVVAASASSQVLRESPFLVRLDDGRLVEGTLDLAYVEAGGWVVVDWKTDVDLAVAVDRYRRQVAWYVFALQRLTGCPARGVVLAV